jgi:hypothetical protein
MVPWRQWVAAVCGGDGPQRSAMARARSPVVSLKPIPCGTQNDLGRGGLRWSRWRADCGWLVEQRGLLPARPTAPITIGAG